MDIEYFLELFSGILILYSIVFFLFLFNRIAKKRDTINIKKYTFDFCNNDKINYEEIVLNSFRKDYRKYDEAKYYEAKTLIILSNFDKISIGLKHNIFDENIIFDYYAKYFVQFYNEFQYFIIERRNISSNSDLFIEYEKLVRRWDVNFKNVKIN